jgi:ribosomal protein L7/L12
VHELQDEARRAYEAGVEWEPILRHLRAQGCGIIDCIKVVRHITDCSLRDAKILVHYSDAWNDQRVQNEEFHELLWKAADEWTEVPRSAKHPED